MKTSNLFGRLALSVVLGGAVTGAFAAEPTGGGAACPPLLDRKVLNLQDEAVPLCQFRARCSWS